MPHGKLYHIEIEVLNKDKYQTLQFNFDSERELELLSQQLKSLPLANQLIKEAYIKSTTLPLPSYTANIILTALIAPIALGTRGKRIPNYLTKIHSPEVFFNVQQQAQLNAFILQNNFLKKTSQTYEAGAFIIGAGVLFFLALTFTIWNAVGIFLSGIAGLFCKEAWHRAAYLYTEIVRARYDTPDKILAIKRPAELEAFKAGVRAKYWGGYFTSFCLPCVYTECEAFDAGMSYATQEKRDLLEVLKKYKPL